MAPELILGVDGGKTKTICLVATANGQVLGWGRTGSSDQYNVPREQALDEIARAADQACQQAGVQPGRLSAQCFGLAGADWPEDFEALRTGLERRGFIQPLVKNDALIALRANTDNGVGVVISAGTHLAAAIRTPGGEEWFSAWYSVEGAGGVRAGHEVLWAVLKASDGRGEPTTLTGLVLAHAGMHQPEELLRALSQRLFDDTFLASLAPLLFEAHLTHADPVAGRLISSLGEDMSRWAVGLLERYHLLHDAMPVILSGGLFKAQDSLLRETVTMHIHLHAPRAQVQLARREPVVGALAYACEQLGLDIDPGFLDNIQLGLSTAKFDKAV
jgi:N-acetylglucosamine kinase-like BadF-type ATPase